MTKERILAGDQEIRITGGRLRVARLEAEFYHYLGNPEPVIAELRSRADRPDVFTFMQGLADPVPRYKYRMEWDNLAVLPVTTFEHWWEKQLLSVARNRMKQASKRGLVLREVPFSDELARGIWNIYNETPVRQGRRFPHYGKAYETVYEEEATFLSDAVFIGAYLGEELVGFVKLVMDGQRVQAGLMNILSMIKHRDKAPNNALIAESVRSLAARGIPNLVYFRFVHGKRGEDGVSEFKTKCGFARVNVPRYYVPLTPWGRTALGLGLHHRFVDRLPEGLSEKLRTLRSRWYNRKNRSEQASAQVTT
jgi:hypothetical protein